MKVTYLFSLFFVSGLFLFPEISGAENSQQYEGEKQIFKVSAYYSPQPNQTQYVSGSYAADLRMNGNGTHGADGTPVYVGMISAPSKYAFETQIYIPGLGVGTVHDRGGAIVSSQGYDRLDIWMGRGDEGRIQAIQWGSKMVSGIILSQKTVNTLEISTSEIARIEIQKTNKTSEKGDHKGTPLRENKNNISKKIHPSTPIGNYFSRNFSRDDKNEEIKIIQKFLIDQEVFSGDENSVTNYYGPKTENAVFLFQKKHKILEAWSDAGAGNWGPKTRKKVHQVLEEKGDHKGTPLRENKNNISKKIHPSTPLENHFSRNFSRDDKNEEIKIIQKFLINQEVFSGDENSVTNYYGPKTENAVFLFQKKHKILEAWSDAGAGNWGPKTRAKANELH